VSILIHMFVLWSVKKVSRYRSIKQSSERDVTKHVSSVANNIFVDSIDQAPGRATSASMG